MATVLQFDEISKLAEDIYYKTLLLPPDKRKEEITDEIEDLLLIAYVFGSDRVIQTVREEQPVTDYEGLRPDAQTAYEAVYKPIQGQTFEERIANRIDKNELDLPALLLIAETEYHRVEETGAYDTAKRYEDVSGYQAFKKWKGMLDARERDMHYESEGQTVPIDEMFTMPDGAQALHPGGFGVPEHDCNCRCWVEYEFR